MNKTRVNKRKFPKMVDNEKMQVESAAFFPLTNKSKFAYSPYSQDEAPRQLMEDDIGAAFFCPHCRLNFMDDTEYEHHNIEMHGGKKILTCSVCTATFRRQDHLKRHMQSLHYNQKFCMCPVCNKDCKRQDLLLKHIQKRHTTDSETFHCRECDFECQSHTVLEKHEFTHMLSERHMCVHCKATFKRRDHMLRHVKSQHSNHSISCPICKQSYKRKDHVVRHVREKHKMGYLNGKLVTSKDMI